MFFIIFYHFFIMFASSGAKILQKKWKITIFLDLFPFFIMCLSFFIMFHHFCFQWCKKFPEMENCNFPRVFSFFVIFLIIVLPCFFSFVYHFFHLFIIFSSCFIIFASSGAKIFQEIENGNFPRLFFIFFIFYHCFIICLSLFNHVSSFLLPVVQKFSKKWKIAMFLDVFSICYHFNHFFIICFNHFFLFLTFFIIFASSGAKIFQKMENCNFPRVFFICLSCFIIVYHFCTTVPLEAKMMKNDKTCVLPNLCNSGTK